MRDKNENKRLSATATVTRFEFHNYLTSKSFIVTTLVVVLLIGLTLNLPYLFSIFKSKSADKQKEVYLVDQTGAYANLESLAAADPSGEYIFKRGEVRDDASYRKLAQAEKTFGIFIIEDAEHFRWITRRKPFNNHLEHNLAELASRELKAQKLQAAGVDSKNIQLAFAEPEIQLTELVEESGKTQERTMPYTYALVIVLYMFLLSYGQMTATSVASEKSTRTMEILITSTQPRNLIYGKVFGAGLAGLFQMAVFGAAYYFFYSLSRLTGMSVQFITGELDLPLSVFIMSVVVFLLTYLAFAFLFSAVGSLVTRSEEVSQVITPLTTIIIGIFFVSIFATFDPDKLWVTISSFIPLVGALVFFVRTAMLEVPIWQSILAAIIHSATVFLCAKIASTIYRNGVLNYGRPPKFKDIFKILKKARKESA